MEWGCLESKNRRMGQLVQINKKIAKYLYLKILENNAMPTRCAIIVKGVFRFLKLLLV